MGTKRLVQLNGGEDYNPALAGANAEASGAAQALSIREGGHFNLSRSYVAGPIVTLDGSGNFWQNVWTPPTGRIIHIHTIWINPTYATTDQGSANTCGDVSIVVAALRYSDGAHAYDFCGCNIPHTDYVAGGLGMHVLFGTYHVSSSMNGAGTKGYSGGGYSSASISGSNVTGWASTWPVQTGASSVIVADTIGVSFSCSGGATFDDNTYDNYGQFNWDIHISGTIG